MIDFHKTICAKVGELCQIMMQGSILQMLKCSCDKSIIEIVEEMYDIIRKHCIFMVYYIFYLECSEKKSIRGYIIPFEHETSVKRDNPEYDNLLYSYKKYRKFKDGQGEEFFKEVEEPPEMLYKKFNAGVPGERIEALSGHELSEQAYIECLYMNKYSIFDAIREGRLGNVKKISNKDFEEIYFPQINSINDGIYDDIMSGFTYDYSKCKYPGFMRCMNFFAIESNCHFERSYLIAKALKKLKVKKDIKNQQRDILDNINVFNDINKYVDKLVLGYTDIFGYYDKGEIDINDIYQIAYFCNSIINKTLHLFLEENYLTEEDFVISEEAEQFFRDFLGEGQHINEKNIEDFAIRDFRYLYNNK